MNCTMAGRAGRLRNGQTADGLERWLDVQIRSPCKSSPTIILVETSMLCSTRLRTGAQVSIWF